MGNKNKRNNQTVAQKVQATKQAPMTLEEQIVVTEDKILEGVKQLASGIDISLSKLIEIGKELIDLEERAEAEGQAEEDAGDDEDLNGEEENEDK